MEKKEEQPASLLRKINSTGASYINYKKSVIGEAGHLQLLVFELINLFCTPVKGNLGQFLRKISFPCLLGSIGHKIEIGTDCTIRNGKKTVIGNNVVLEDNVSLLHDGVTEGTGINLSDHVRVGERTILKCSGGVLSVGKGSSIGKYCRIGSLVDLTIGEHSRIGNRCCIAAASHCFSSTDEPVILQPLTCEGPITIRNHVTIGDQVTILAGVTIGNNVKILNDSLVKHDISDNVTVSGVPAQIVSKEVKG